MFAPDESRVFALPPGVDFAEELVRGLVARMHDRPPEAMARVRIFTNTRRAARRFEEVFAAAGPMVLPQIKVIPEMATDPAGPLVPHREGATLSRQFALLQLVKTLLRRRPDLAPLEAGFDLSQSLLALLDEMQAETVPIARLINLGGDLGDLNAHRETTLRFLKIIAEYVDTTPDAPLGGDARRRASVAALAAAWAAAPPPDPVIVAGSTGSRAAISALMAAVLTLPAGAIVLPGFDFDLHRRGWQAIDDGPSPRFDHPQYGFHSLASRLDFDPGDVARWTETAPRSPARNRMVSLALRAAPVTDEWITAGPALGPELADACAGLAWLDAPTGRHEAAAVALALRDALEHGQRSVLITPDGILARRVTAWLNRWGIVPDESAGTPLPLTPPALFLSLLLEAGGGALATPDFIAILKHPLTASGADRGQHMHHVRQLERDRLRSGMPYVDWADIAAWARHNDAVEWAAWLRVSFAMLSGADVAPLADHMNRHRAAANALASGPETDAAHAIWDKEAGRLCARVLDAIGAEGAAAGPVTGADYRAIVKRLIAAERARLEGYRPDLRIAIWGQLEARVQSADLVILGGLNEGVWPSQPPPDPWLNREMRRALGLSSPDRTIGLAAHDFQQGIANERVILSRSLRDGTAPTVASRWLTRLDNLLGGLGPVGAEALADMRARGQVFGDLAEEIDRPTRIVPPAPRPAPAPPIAARPDTISATEVERLVRDPYAVYATRILRLRPMDPPGRDPSALDRGIALHRVMESFIAETRTHMPEDAAALFAEIAARVLRDTVPWPAAARIWTARLARISDALMADEAARRDRAQPFRQEVMGRIDIPGLIRPMALTAKADRIDRDADGRLAIYDYKSSLPTDKQERIFSRQLPLEAVMAARGGFEHVGKGAVLHLELIGLAEAHQAVVMSAAQDDLADVWRKFTDLLAHFLLPDTGYAARLYPFRSDTQGDYDHLARRGEWQDGADYVPEPVS